MKNKKWLFILLFLFILCSCNQKQISYYMNMEHIFCKNDKHEFTILVNDNRELNNFEINIKINDKFDFNFNFEVLNEKFKYNVNDYIFKNNKGEIINYNDDYIELTGSQEITVEYSDEISLLMEECNNAYRLTVMNIDFVPR